LEAKTDEEINDKRTVGMWHRFRIYNNLLLAGVPSIEECKEIIAEEERGTRIKELKSNPMLLPLAESLIDELYDRERLSDELYDRERLSGNEVLRILREAEINLSKMGKGEEI